jgi:hypothetical protein
MRRKKRDLKKVEAIEKRKKVKWKEDCVIRNTRSSLN